MTGGAGMVGSNLVAELLNLGHFVTIIDNFWRGSIDNLKETCKNNFDKVNIVIADFLVVVIGISILIIKIVFFILEYCCWNRLRFSNEGYLLEKIYSLILM